ncbi:FtsX-like permease family protein [Streptomyces corynorhini]|uniref:ABC transporter permease n=1 Tax=Streptomyces corynorhini TaxID=2282652 RepID=A0A370B3W7_9ACTN|nr:ABC transporter permease [Streptomyces corynorhini]RDG36537.1 ABC transporter permease [Streptomyces corynorhini]
MTGFVFLRAAGHRLLLAAALLAVALTTCVIASLTAFSVSVGDTALRETLRGRDTASAVLVVSADVPAERRDAAEKAVARGARETFDGLPVTVRKLERSGPYALPGSLRAGRTGDASSQGASSQGAASEGGSSQGTSSQGTSSQGTSSKGTRKPDLTHFAALDRSRITLVAGELPGRVPGPVPGRAGDTDGASDADADGTSASASASAPVPVPVALPEEAARRLELAPGARITLTDRLTDDRLTIRVTGVYRATDPTDPYWRLDALGGRGVRELDFTTYGPLLADASVLVGGRVPGSTTGWLATADYRSVTTGRIDALRTAATRVPERLREDPALGGGATVSTALPSLLDRTERALLVSRSTLVIVALQLLLLAGYTLLLVARSLGAERAGETGLLRARGASGGRLAALAATEALLLALPAALCAPLLAGPLAGLLARRSALGGDGAGAGSGSAAGAGSGAGAYVGTGLGGIPAWPVWGVSAGVALCCAALVVLPAVAGTAGATAAPGGARGRLAALPTPVRAGADIGLLLVAVLAYWQLDRQTGTGTGAGAAGTGVLGRDREGRLGIDPLLALAPALALLAGTVLTLRLLPPLARLAERGAAKSRGLPGALAAHRLGRRSLRGAGPVLLLVLAVATGLLALGQSASWDRSQHDQADFATGASVRVVDGRPADPGQAGFYAALPGVRQAAPAHRADADLSGGVTATVLALDTAHAEERMLLRDDLADASAQGLMDGLTDAPAQGPTNAPVQGPKDADRTGIPLPDDTRRLLLDVRIGAEDGRAGASPSGLSPAFLVVVEDRYGLRYRLSAGQVPVDGRLHRLALDLDLTASGSRAAPAGPLRVTGLRLAGDAPDQKSERHRLSVERLLVTRAEEGVPASVPVPVPVRVPDETRWRGSVAVTRGAEESAPVDLAPAVSATAPLTVSYPTGRASQWDGGYFAVRLDLAGAAVPERIAAVATDGFLRATGAGRGDSVDLTLAGEQVRVTIVETVRELPTAGPAAAEAADAGAAGDADTPDAGALLVDLRAVNAVVADRADRTLMPNEWWLSTGPGAAAKVAAALRDRSDGAEPEQVFVRDETAAGLLGDPLGDGARSALIAVALAAAALAAVGFAVGAAASLRERTAELAVLRALGAPRRSLARLVVTEQGVLIGIGLTVGTGLGVLLTRALVPLTVLTSWAARPVPQLIVELPLYRAALLLAGVAAVPLLITAALAARRGARLTDALRHQGER